MEYIRIKLSKDEDVTHPVPVLINGEENGFVGNLICIQDGTVTISVKLDGAKEAEFKVPYGSTESLKPREIVIDVGQKEDK